jgi:hypothetical protein
MKATTWRKIFILGFTVFFVLAGCGGGGENGAAAQDGSGGQGGTSRTEDSGQAVVVDAAAADFGYVLNGTKDGIRIVYYTGSSDTIVIPDTIENYPVVELRSDVFQKNTTLKSISLPDTITEIPAEAFNGCSSLTDIKWPASLDTIGSSAFRSTAFAALEFPPNLTTIGTNAFRDCSKLKNVTLPESLNTIRGQAFLECRELRSLNVPASLRNFPRLAGDWESYPNNAFNWCDKLPLAVRDQLVQQGYSANEF